MLQKVEAALPRLPFAIVFNCICVEPRPVLNRWEKGEKQSNFNYDNFGSIQHALGFRTIRPTAPEPTSAHKNCKARDFETFRHISVVCTHSGFLPILWDVIRWEHRQGLGRGTMQAPNHLQQFQALDDWGTELSSKMGGPGAYTDWDVTCLKRSRNTGGEGARESDAGCTGDDKCL